VQALQYNNGEEVSFEALCEEGHFISATLY